MRLWTGPLVVALCWLCFAQSTRAVPPAKDPDLTLIESTERDEDPLGIDEATGKELDLAASKLPENKPKAVLPSAERGEVLTAIASVREQSHRVRVRFALGLAFVETVIVLENRGPHAAEVAYRLAVPDDAVLVSLRACSSGTCGAAEAPTQPKDAQIYARGERISDTRGAAISLLAKPVGAAPLTLRVDYVCAAKVFGGRVAWTLPQRGFDPRIVPAEVEIIANGLTITEQLEAAADPSRPYTIRAELTKNVETKVSATCDGERAELSYRAARARPFETHETWLLLDSSPSMEGPARSRAPVVLGALLSQLPEHTPLVVFGFAARAERLGSYQAGEAPLTTLTDAIYEDRGGGTKPSSVLHAFHDEIAKKRPRIVIISDGRLDPADKEKRALERARQLGAPLWLVGLAEEGADARLTDLFKKPGGLLWITTLADRALGDQDLTRLSDALAPIMSPREGRGLSAGEELVAARRITAKGARKSGSNAWLCRWLQAENATGLAQGSAANVAAIGAPPYVASAPAKTAVVDSGMPKESVLNLLRTQLIPRARACLRTDRKGRADYAVGLAFRMTLVRREALDASIEGKVPNELKGCLLDVLPTLKLPWFTGRLRVRYPIHTEREAEPPTIELEPEAEATLKRALESTKPTGGVLKMR